MFFLFCFSSEKTFSQVYQTWRSEANSDSWQGSINWWKGSAGGIEFGQQEWNNNHYTTQWNNNGGNTLSTWRWLFQSGASQAHTFKGDAVRFYDYNGSDPAIINQSSATHVFDMSLNGDGNSGDPLNIQIDNNGGGGFTFNGAFNNQGSDLRVIGTASSAATVTFNGVVSGGGGFYKENANITVVMTNANTYSGQTTIQNGVLRLQGNGSLASSAVRLHSGATLQISNNATVASVAEQASGNAGVIAISNNATLTINESATGLFQNSISGAGGLTFSGSGSLSLYGTQSYSGTTTVTGGTLSTGSSMSSGAYSLTGGTFRTTAANLISDTATITLGGGTLSIGGTETFGNSGVTLSSNSSTVSVDSGITASVSGAVTGSGNISKSGSGQFNLSGNSDYSGTTTVSAGSLEVQSANALGSTAAGTTVNSGAELRLWNATGVSVAAEGLTLNGGGISSTGALRNISGNNTWSGAITLASASRINSDGGKLTLDVASGNGITGTHNLTFGGAGSVEVNDPIATSTGTVTKDGSGTLTLAGNNTYSGETLLNDGTILVGNNGAFGTGTMTINYDTGSGTRSLASSSASNFTLNNNFNLYFNSFTLGQASGGTGSLTLGGSGKNFYLGNDASTANRVITVNGNHEIAAAVTGGANNHIVKQGSGQLTLSGANTSTGNIYIDSGTINLSGGSLGAGNIDLGGGSANNSINSDNATLKVTSGSFSRPITVNAETTSGGASGSRTIEFANTSGTATLSGNVSIEKNVSVTTASGGIGKLSGVISRSGTAGIIKTGAGTLDLGAQTHSVSSIAVQQGTLLLGAANQLGASTTSAADLNFSAGTTLKTALDLTGNILTLAGTAAQADTIFDFNSGSGNDFAFGSTTWYGGNLKLSNVAIGTIINFGTFTGNAGLTFNDFQSKVSFSDTGLQAQINFSGTSLSVAAIPEPKVYVAAGVLTMLIGYAEYRRRRGQKTGVSS